MKRVTIYDVAKLANVSPTTVSRALHDHPAISEGTKQRVRAACEQLAYVPDIVARGLSGQKTHTIGVIVTDISDPYLSALCAVMERHCSEHGYRMLLSNTLHDPQYELEAVGRMLSQQVDGLLISAHSPQSQARHRALIGDLPCVYLGNNHTADCSYVEVDNERGAYEAAQYLYHLGHRRIAFVGGRADSRTLELRLKGYRRSLLSHGLPLREIVGSDHVEDLCTWCYQQTLDELRSGDGFDAVIAYTDRIAMSIVDAAEASGLRVPEDFSLIGFDDIVFGQLRHVRLTSVSQSHFRTGQLAVERLLAQIDGSCSRTADIIEPELMIRDTCRRIERKERSSL